jgi:hypothetical protein
MWSLFSERERAGWSIPLAPGHLGQGESRGLARLISIPLY